MKTVDEIIDDTIAVEGKYVNNIHDSGGETNWGITIDTARRNGYIGPMTALTREQAVRIYKSEYWLAPKFDEVFNINPNVAMELFDTGVNCGPLKAKQFLQKSLNALNRQGKDYTDMYPDGKIGSRTLHALYTFLELRGAEGEKVLLKMLNVLQGTHYLELAARREKDEEFVFGWFRTRIELPR